MNNFFKDLKVIEIASVLAGPSVGLFFSELNADVTKYENKKTNGDVTRSWKLPSENKNNSFSAYFCSVNWKKSHDFIDLTNQKDLIKIKDHIAEADVIILNFKKGDDIKFGLDYHSLKNINPKLIYATINGFGEESDRVAYDLILQAESGFMSMNGTPTSGPVKMPVALIDILAGHQLKQGILVALLERTRNGKGQKVSVSLYESAIAALANQATNWLMNNHIAQPIGSTHPNISPYGELFTCKDGIQITFAIGSDKQFKNLTEALNMENVWKDDLFISNSKRVKNRIILAKKIQESTLKYNSNDIINKLHKLFVPVAKINDMQEVFRNPLAQNMILNETIKGVETKRVKTVVFKQSY